MLKNSRYSWTLLLGAGVALLAAALFLWIRNGSGSAQGLDLHPGQTLRYQMSYRSEGRGQVDMKATAQNPGLSIPEKIVQVDVQSHLQLRVISQDTSGFAVNFYLKPAVWRLVLDGQEQGALPEHIEGRLHLSRQGLITGFQLDPSAYQTYGFVLADILSLLEFHLPAPDQGEVLTAEKTFHGEAGVRFVKDAAGAGGFRLLKSYLPGGNETIEGFGRYDGNSKTYLHKVEAERQRSYADAQGNSSRDTTRFTLETSESQETWVSSEAKPYGLSETLGGASYRKKVEESIHVNRLGQRTWNDVRALLETVEGSDQKHKTDVLMMLRSYIYLHPQELQSLLPYLTEVAYDLGATGVVAAALTDIGSPEAQAILREAIDASNADLERKEKLVAHLALVDEITPESEQTIYHLAEDEADDRVKGAAELGVGVIGHMHLENRQPGVDKAMDFARKKLANATTSEDREQALRIVGNIGSPAQIAIIKPYLKDPSELTRYTAIKSLRAVNDPAAFGILRQVIAEEKNQNLRAAAIESLSTAAQDPETYAYLKQQLFVERDDRMIKQIITHLVNMRRQYPDVRPLLETYIKQCGKTDVCGFASSAIASM